jgi:hypothetical protein
VSPSISGSTATIRNAGHTLTVQRLAPQSASASATSMTSVSGDYNGGYRLDERMSGGDNRFIHVLSIDGAATSATVSGDTVTVNVGGQSATITFNHDAPGATMTYAGKNVSLDATVDMLAP